MEFLGKLIPVADEIPVLIVKMDFFGRYEFLKCPASAEPSAFVEVSQALFCVVSSRSRESEID
ncbi:hypothetical protein RRF57_010626 [Xylaria bambusicola]|uniref:Uncharacterized protein n=1 Tax=Xylaria bambusicola TaxID=326684 RepID=A0AAN7UVA1_9PEZI